MNMYVVPKQKMGLTWNMVLWQQNGDFIYGLHLSMAIATPNLKFIPCVEAKIPGVLHLCLPMKSYFIHHYLLPSNVSLIAKHSHTFK